MVSFSLGGNLWKHGGFMRLWFSNTVVQFGNQFSALALPVLVVLEFNATPFDTGVLIALAILPYPLLGLFVGVWVDRFKKRRTMIICNLGRMLTLASIPVSYLLGTLSLPQVFAVAFVSGTFSVFFDIAYQAYLPTLVDRKDLIEGNQKLQLSISGAQVAGPGVAGIVYQAVGGALTCAIDAFGYFVAMVSLVAIKDPEQERKKTSDADFFGEMKEGLRVVFRNPLLSSIAASTATSNLGTTMVGAVLTFFCLKELHFSPFEFGVIGSIGALGFVFGAIFVNRITARLGLGRMLAVSTGLGVTFVVAPLALYGYSFVILSAVMFVSGLGLPLFMINQVSLRQAITPDRLQGRMNATMKTVITSLIPIGSVIGGALGDAVGVVDVFYLGGAIAGLSGAWILFGPVLKLKKQPEPLAE